MSDIFWKELGHDFLKQIYLHKGGVEVEILRGVITATYELSEDLFNGVLERLVEKGYCVVESIKKLNASTEKVVFITMKGLEQLATKRKISIKKVLANKISYEMKCEGCGSFSVWLEKNRSMLAFENEKNRMYATALGNMDIILMKFKREGSQLCWRQYCMYWAFSYLPFSFSGCCIRSGKITIKGTRLYGQEMVQLLLFV